MVKRCSNSKIEPILKANFFVMLMKIRRVSLPPPNHMNSLEIHKDSLEKQGTGLKEQYKVSVFKAFVKNLICSTGIIIFLVRTG